MQKLKEIKNIHQSKGIQQNKTHWNLKVSINTEYGYSMFLVTNSVADNFIIKNKWIIISKEASSN